jgi:hypothetical protein
MFYVTFATSICIALVAAWYSVSGLIVIFAGAAVPTAIMASVLEVGKLVTTAWLHVNWRHAPISLRVYLTSAVIVLMLVTSMGIFGFLSKAHLEQSVKATGNNDLKIENLERQVERQQAIIKDAEAVLYQLDKAVATLIEYDRIRGPEGSIAVRESQKEERQSLNDTINITYARIEELQFELIPLQQARLSLEAEIGPLKYIAEMIYGQEDAQSNFDAAVRWVILLLVSVFDPLAVVLLIASLHSLQYNNKIKHNTAIADQDNVHVVLESDMDDNTGIVTKVVDQLTPR